MQTVLITGGTGLIGKALTKQLLAKDYKVIIITRRAKEISGKEQLTYAAWDIKNQTIDIKAVQSSDFIIHLAGAPVVEKKWTEAYKKEIVDSRILGSKLLCDTLKNNVHKVKAIISASAIGWYGADKEPGHYFTENEKASDDFLGHTCLLWEQSISKAEDTGIRVCKLRTGIVLSNDGGALVEFKKPLRTGIAGILSSGKQMVSWIHLDDLCRIYIHAMENELAGAYNAVAPRPVTNKKLTLLLAKALRGKFYIPMHVPAFILKLVMGKRSVEVLKSATVSCEKIRETEFTFIYPSIDAAFTQLTKEPSEISV